MFSAHRSKLYGVYGSMILFITLMFYGWGCQKSSTSQEKTSSLVSNTPLKASPKKKQPPLIGREIILKNIDKIGPSRQVILVTTQATKIYHSLTMPFEKVKGKWE
ncbi:MAG TPA: hypothetical protein ENI73_10870, partial [Spirochaetes bacterium]|nr:hypothetical protein [Spirochaetota bacterium]